jgi:uncharacterized membrane protein
MECGCMLMIASEIFGIGSIFAGLKLLDDPVGRQTSASPETFFIVGIAFILAPFVWIWWANKQDEKRWRK